MAGFLGDAANPSGIGYGYYNSDALVEGTPNMMPTISDTPETSVGSVFNQVKDLLGALGTTAREVGQVVGQAETTIRGADDAYRAGRAQGQREAEAMNWWQRRTEFEKVTIVIAGAALLVGVVSLVRGS